VESIVPISWVTIEIVFPMRPTRKIRSLSFFAIFQECFIIMPIKPSANTAIK